MLVRQVFLFVLGVGVEHVNPVRSDEIVNDSDATALASAGTPSAYLAKAAGAWDEIAGLWPVDEHGLKLSIRIIVDELHDLLCKNRGFIENHRLRRLRHWRRASKA